MDGAQIRRGAKNLVGVAKEEGDLAMESGEARERKSGEGGAATPVVEGVATPAVEGEVADPGAEGTTVAMDTS